MISVSVSWRQVAVAAGQQVLPQLLIVGQLAVEGEAEPLVLLHVLPLERLGVAAVFGPAGGVTHLADGGTAGVFAHQALRLAAMAEPEHFADAAQVLEGVDELVAVGIVRGHAGRQLAAILDVEQHAGQQPRHLLGPLLGTQRAAPAAGQVVDRRDATLVQQIAHGNSLPVVAPDRTSGTRNRKSSREINRAATLQPTTARPRAAGSTPKPVTARHAPVNHCRRRIAFSQPNAFCGRFRSARASWGGAGILGWRWHLASA